MIEFNPDGSLKLPAAMQRKKDDDKNKLLNQRCIKIKKEVVNFSAPKKMRLAHNFVRSDE